MASKPGILTEWPWTRLGNFKYSSQWQRESINNLIEKAIMEAGQKGIKITGDEEDDCLSSKSIKNILKEETLK
ncbi:hypothetical protein RND71_026705 [Anisodus tanguticus]|uniref:Uncharacterized protein n=1 Tax=Anisodus tanguticus TaxID=243964 RepID=A0AAE1RMS6_9SOLA|nr:hypothetical protein RND71_026705 [Anisodus tanguticus]